jgi:sugar lactone lactonase YvrE
LAICSSTNGDPGDLIIPDGNGNIIQLSINPSFGAPSLYWDGYRTHGWGGMAFDQAGNLYLSEDPRCPGCGSIYKLSADRTTLTPFASGLNYPAGLAVDTAGNVYVTAIDLSSVICDETGNCHNPGNVYKYTPDGAPTTFARDVAADGSGNIVFDVSGNLVVSKGGYIYKIAPSGDVNIFCILPRFWGATAVAFDSSGNLFALSRDGNGHYRLYKYPPQGGTGADGIIFGARDEYPFDCGIGGDDLSIDSADNIYTGSRGYINMYPPTYLCGDPISTIYAAAAEPEYQRSPFETFGQLAIQPLLAAPQLQSVVSRMTHGSNETFDLPLSTNSPTVEPRNNGTGNYTIVFNFDKAVNSGNADITSGTGTAGRPTFDSNSMIVNLTGVTDQQTLNVSVSNVAGPNTLPFASASAQIGFLYGDVNGDGVVNVGDTILVRSIAGATLDNTNFQYDVNADGLVNVGDTIIVRNNSGNFLSAPSSKKKPTGIQLGRRGKILKKQ